jgi:hypothetical protein
MDPDPGMGWRRAVVGGAGAALVGVALLAFLHAYTSARSLVAPMYVMGGAALVLGAAAMLGGVAYALRRYPQHRRATVFIVGLTVATLVAHAFVMGTPPAATPASVSGDPAVGFGDGRVVVNGTEAGGRLQLTVLDAGSDAIADVSASVGGVPLPESGFAGHPSFASPLQPHQSVTGEWDVGQAPANSTVTVYYQDLTCYSTKSQAYGCIMDEVYYVPEGMAILQGLHCTDQPGGPSYCHMEHPYLVPALIAAGMAVFGEYDAVGWRVFPALLGTFSVPLLFGVAWKLSESKKLAAVAALLLSLDVMFFSQSSAAVLDVPQVFFGLAAFFAYFADLKWWKFDRYAVAGVLLGVAGLAKETAVFLVLALLTYVAFFEEGGRWTRTYHVLKVTLVVGVVFAAGLQAYDSTLAAPAVPTFVQDVGYILSYGSSLVARQLACQPVTGYWCKFANDPGGPPILPTDWLVYYSPVAYYLVTAASSAGEYVVVGYYGTTNLLITWTTFVWAPLLAWRLWSRRRGRAGGGAPPLPAPDAADGGETRLAGFTLILFAWTYLPYLALFAAGRVTYPFYVVPAIPAMALGASYWLTRRWFPRWLAGVYLAAVFLFFLVYFPDKSFLPVWLRVLLRH